LNSNPGYGCKTETLDWSKKTLRSEKFNQERVQLPLFQNFSWNRDTRCCINNVHMYVSVYWAEHVCTHANSIQGMYTSVSLKKNKVSGSLPGQGQLVVHLKETIIHWQTHKTQNKLERKTNQSNNLKSPKKPERLPQYSRKFY